ncbi:serine hydrolase domain-containing protein [Rhabdothermincola sediminis]|uniref:serine hydrolase domain-containing protein n=1 Tax=Rhabdothermincola sediminis TaxID=2751370 RepID=UPI001AA06A78|nr:serine hydrolase domain-containing protein [Rhabdothermincola sediminis]
MADIEGEVAPGFEAVRAAFEQNFSEGLEIGAAFSAYHRGEKVVDLWGGTADVETGAPWREDTIILVFSTTKGATAMCANKLAQEGRLDVEAPVATYWPEFAKNGKDDITVAHLLSHQAGLAWVDGDMTAEEALSWEPVIEALENQHPAWVPGSQHGYHATTYGWLVGEVVRRIAGRSVGTYFREEIAEPLGADFWIGLPESEEHRVARLQSMIPASISVDMLANPGDDPVAQMIATFLGPDTPLGKALFAPGGALTDQDVWNSRAMRAAEVPAANGVTDARSVARLYAACIGEVDGVRILTEEQVKRATEQRTTGPNTVLMDMDIQFGLGFMLHSSMVALGGPRSFGHFGAGGSMGWADPDAELAFGYVMNRMDMGLAGDPRSFRLVTACYDAIA